jgi:hypothetical protein
MDYLKLVLAMAAGISLAAAYLSGEQPSFLSQRSAIASQAAFAPYRNCAAARADGAAPVYRGQPGYAPWLDRDNDGIGCEWP